MPTTPDSISEILSEKWAMTAYPRDITPRVIQRLLDNSQAYGIFRILDPEPEEPEEEKEQATGEEVTVGDPQETAEVAKEAIAESGEADTE